ncbi:MAG: hypothetical protein KC545_16195, partial [Nitrospira sp.]|nr:hypothetical protein [Nitrospira sp.]
RCKQFRKATRGVVCEEFGLLTALRPFLYQYDRRLAAGHHSKPTHADHALIVSKHLGYWQLKIPNVIDASTDERL